MDFNGLNRCFFSATNLHNFSRIFLLNLCELWKLEHSVYSDMPHDHSINLREI